MNIVFVSLRSPLSYPGGAEILTQVIAESLVQRGHRVTIYTAGRGRRHVVRGVAVCETPLLALPLRLRTTLLPLYSLLLGPLFARNREFSAADIVHAIDSDSIILLSSWRFLRDKFVVTIQDYALVWPTVDYFSTGVRMHALRKFFRVLTMRLRSGIRGGALSRVRHAICVSRFVARQVSAVHPNVRCAVIGNCISPDWKAVYRGGKRDIDLLYVGKLMPYKGLDVFLQAVRQMRLSRINVVVVGEGLSERYAALAARLGISDRVTFTGPVAYAQMPSYYRRSNIVVSSSIWPEPCGRSIIEAMWMGCAVVATHVGGTPESLVDGAHGYLVPARRPSAIAKACSALLVDKERRSRLGRRAALYARRMYSANRIVAMYEAQYHLIKSNRLV